MEERRVAYTKLNKLVDDVADLQKQMQENTTMTAQVRDILASFRILGIVCKWVAGVAAAIVAIYHGITSLKG